MATMEQDSLTVRNQGWAWMFGITLAYIASIWVLNLGLPVDRAIEEMFIHRPCTSGNYYGCWVLDKSNHVYTFILHTLPNWLFTGLGSGAALVFAASFFHRPLRLWRELSLTLLIGVGGVSGIVALMKHHTGHYCPAQLAYYGGPVGDIPPLKPSPACYPAGHPSPGFGLMVLYFGALPRFWRRLGLYAGLGCGTLLSLIQMGRGEHFLSHCLATALTAVFTGCIVHFLNRLRENTRYAPVGN